MTDEATTAAPNDAASETAVAAINSAPHEAASNAGSAPPTATIAEGLRLRMKVWTDPRTGRRYLIPMAFMTDPKLGTMAAYVMTDEDTKIIKLSAVEWNSLPFYYFKEDGPAPRATSRPVDVIR